MFTFVGYPPVGTVNFLFDQDNSADEIIAREASLYVTELIGFGSICVTGDYSAARPGLWIENGELSYPVEEVTIAGNLKRCSKYEMGGADLNARQNRRANHQDFSNDRSGN